MSDAGPLSDLECREESLAKVRDALAAMQRVPAAGLDAEKHEAVREVTDGLVSLERSLSNEVEQIRGGDGGE